MGRLKKSKRLEVYLNGMKVGNLSKQTDGLNTFQYGSDWLDMGFAISNSLPLQEDEYRGEVVAKYFDNLLPDNEEIKKSVATKFGASSVRSFDLLSVMGKDCVGALSFLPEVVGPGDITQLQYREVTEGEIAQKLKGLGNSTPLGMRSEVDFRISIAGAQEKTAFLKIEDQWFEPQGMTPTTHIFKTSIGALGHDISFNDSIDNEWACLKILEKFHLPVCKANIETFEDQRSLVVERFDRRWEKLKGKDFILRLPQEDMCQALGYSPYQKYQSDGGPGFKEMFNLLRSSKEEKDREHLFKAMMIFDLLFATDGHGKNFSLFLERDGIRLTPFYDVMSGYFLHKREKQPLQKLKLAMSVGHSGHYAFKRIRLKHYREMAKICGISEELFEKIHSDLSKSYRNLDFSSEEIGKEVNHNTLEFILEGMKIRSKILEL